jgi:DNA-binding transcriptional MerR regulator
MAHEIAKLVLEKAGTFLERTEAVRTALSLGMSLQEIESYLDWLENMRSMAGTEPRHHEDAKED